MPLDAQILLSILAHETSSGDISRTLRATPASYSLTLGDGTGANQAQVVWSDADTIPAAGGDTLNFSAMQDDRGAVAFSAIKAIFLRNTGAGSVSVSTNAVGQPEDWTSGPLAANQSDVYQIPPGGVWLAVNPSAVGWAVGPGDNCAIGISSPSGTTYEIVLIGEGTVT